MSLKKYKRIEKPGALWWDGKRILPMGKKYSIVDKINLIVDTLHGPRKVAVCYQMVSASAIITLRPHPSGWTYQNNRYIDYKEYGSSIFKNLIDNKNGLIPCINYEEIPYYG